MSQTASLVNQQTSLPTEHFDVIIVGAGISGIGGAYHLTEQCPEKTFVVLEGLESFGGTWHMHRYPGIRSGSDLCTFGYRFKPWTARPSPHPLPAPCHTRQLVERASPLDAGSDARRNR